MSSSALSRNMGESSCDESSVSSRAFATGERAGSVTHTRSDHNNIDFIWLSLPRRSQSVRGSNALGSTQRAHRGRRLDSVEANQSTKSRPDLNRRGRRVIDSARSHKPKWNADPNRTQQANRAREKSETRSFHQDRNETDQINDPVRSPFTPVRIVISLAFSTRGAD